MVYTSTLLFDGCELIVYFRDYLYQQVIDMQVIVTILASIYA